MSREWNFTLCADFYVNTSNHHKELGRVAPGPVPALCSVFAGARGQLHHRPPCSPVLMLRLTVAAEGSSSSVSTASRDKLSITGAVTFKYERIVLFYQFD